MPLSNSSHASSVNREALLLLVRICASRRPDLLLAVPVGGSSLVRVVGDSVLQLEEVVIGCGIDVGGVAFALAVALALHVVLIVQASGALKLRRIGGEAQREAVVAAGCAAKDEFVYEEAAVALCVGGLAGVIVVVVFVVVLAGGNGAGSSKAGGSKGDDGRGTHV